MNCESCGGSLDEVPGCGCDNEDEHGAPVALRPIVVDGEEMAVRDYSKPHAFVRWCYERGCSHDTLACASMTTCGACGRGADNALHAVSGAV